MKNKTVLVFAILLIGVIYRVLITVNGNFYFNMDNARDMVDIREMVVLQKPRLIGPTSAIEGVFTGPGWYYLLAVPFIISGGDPYASIIFEILLWAIGGFFLLKIVSRYGFLSLILVGSLWVASNFIVLATQYAFNPNPIILLMPLLIFLLEKYLQTNKLILSISVWFLAGLFLHFEMAAGISIPIIIVSSFLILGKKEVLLSKNSLFGFIVFLLTLFPQVFFDLRHQFIMSTSLMKYLSDSDGNQMADPLLRIFIVGESFYKTLLPTYMNLKIFTNMLVIAYFLLLINVLKNRDWKSDLIFLISTMFIFVPLIGFILLPMNVNGWHLGAVMVSSLFILAIFLRKVEENFPAGKLVAMFITLYILINSMINISRYIDSAKVPFGDSSLLRTEIVAIDYVYREAANENFKVYTYLPSVYDWPYQYLYWWHGLKKYGYVPVQYEYSPNKPPIVRDKDKLNTGVNPENSGLVFLIKEPDTIGIRHLWENQFKDLEFLKSENIGPLIIETRREK